MKTIYCASWEESEGIEIKEVTKYEILVTFGGGMGGANRRYYSNDIKKSNIFDNENYISIDYFGEEIELNLAHIVEIKKCLTVEMFNKAQNSLRVFNVGRADKNYKIEYKYASDWYESKIYEINNLETDIKETK